MFFGSYLHTGAAKLGDVDVGVELRLFDDSEADDQLRASDAFSGRA
jgi:predicted nucleotidyltransferase